MQFVTIGVSDIMLHMPDDHVAPVGYIKSTVFAKHGIGGTEVAISGNQQRLFRSSPDFAQGMFHGHLFLGRLTSLLVLVLLHFSASKTVTVELIVFQTKETDRIGYEKILLDVFREM